MATRTKKTGRPIRVGLTGIGFMGWIHYLAYQRVPGIEVAAICSRDQRKRSGDWRGIQGNFGPPGEKIDVSRLRTYADYSEMLQDPDLDLIDLCLPPHMHPKANVEALRAGKAALVEKPMTLSRADCQGMTHASNRDDHPLFVAHAPPNFPEYA